MKEIEIKIKLADREALIKKVEELGGERIPEDVGLVRDIMYNNQAGDFDVGNKNGKHLRLRAAPFGNRLTYKEKLAGEQHKFLLQRTEIETGVQNVESVGLILKKLGLNQYRVREKTILDYWLDGFRLEFHTLPFLGEFLEIEGGEEQALKKILSKLNLSVEQGINRGYSQLFLEFCEKNNWPPETPLTFEEEKHRRGK